MKRREFLKSFTSLAIGTAACAAISPFINGCTKNGEKKWNFLFILADDLGWNQVGYHGFSYYETPNINRIAAEGIYFTDAYAAASICSPTRASLMTGKYPARLHLTDYIPGSPYPYARLDVPKQAACLPLEEVTIAELLKQNGYVTGHFGKWHLSPDKAYQPGRPFDPGSQGFDEVFASVKPEEDADPDKDAHHAIEITKKSLQFMERHKDHPFFLYVSHHVVHRPIMENKGLIAKYEAKQGSDRPENNPTMGAMIERMDWGIGELLKKLDELNLTEKTIVIFYSDNGGFEALQDQYPLRGGKAMIFEGGLRVPMAIRWPGVITPGSKTMIPVISNDFFPTVAEMTDIPYDKNAMDGKSLMPLLEGAGKINRDALYWHYPHYHHLGYKPAGAIREGDYKLIEWYEETILNLDGQINLYNVREDIGETTDLADKMPEKAARLRDKLHKWLMAVNAQGMAVNPNYDPTKADSRFE